MTNFYLHKHQNLYYEPSADYTATKIKNKQNETVMRIDIVNFRSTFTYV